MALMRSMMTVGGHTMISRILGYARDNILAQVIGAGAVTDAFFMALKLPSIFRRLFAEGAFNAAFVPMFAGNLAAKGKQSAKVFAEHAIMILALFLLFMVISVECFMPEFVKILAPGFEKTPERLMYTIEFTRITFPFILFISVSAILGGILNSLDRFAAPASAQSVGNLIIIGALYFFSHYAVNAGYIAAWGALASSLAQFVWLYFFCVLAGVPIKLRVPKLTPEVKEFFKKLLPGMVGAGVVQINLLVDVWLGSYLPEASISYLNYADRVNQFPLGIIGVAMGVALLPLLTKQIRQGEIAEAVFTQNRATEFALLLTIPAAVAIMIYADSFVALLYGYGKFLEHASNIDQTAYTLGAFCVGLPAYVLIKVFSSSFFARQDTVTPVAIGSISVLVNLVINWQLMKYYQHVGIALGTAIASWVNVILLAGILKRRKMMILDRQLLTSTPKILLSAGIMGVLIYYIEPYFGGAIIQGAFWEKMFILSILLVVGLIGFLLPAYFLKAIDPKGMSSMMSREEKIP